MFDVEVNPEELKKLTKNSNQESFVMLNLLKFKKGDGKKYYARYMAETAPFTAEVGATVEYLGIPGELLTGKEDWDLLMMVRYPSRKAFLDLISNPGYLKVHEWRVKGVERAVLYPTDPVDTATFIKSALK